MNEHKPCPHCGRDSAAVFAEQFDPKSDWVALAQCGDCGQSGPAVPQPTYDEAIDAAWAAWDDRKEADDE